MLTPFDPSVSRVQKSAARRAMRIAQIAAMGACTPPSSSLLPTVIYPSTVKDAQARLFASLAGTQATALLCTGLDAPTRSGWNAFFTAASAFALEDPGLFGLGSRMDQVQTYGYQLCQWQEKIGAVCPLSVPGYTPEQPIPSSAGTYAAWVAAAVVAGTIVYLAGPAIRRSLSRFA